MKMKKIASVVALGTVLSISASSVFAASSVEPNATKGNIPTSPPTVTSTSNATGSAEPLAELGDPSGGIGVYDNNLVIDDKNISQSNGVYERSWYQPPNWKYYRFYVRNTTNTSVTVQIKQNGYTQTYSLSANSHATWTQSEAVKGDHKIVVSTSDGRTFTGDVSVRTSDAPFN